MQLRLIGRGVVAGLIAGIIAVPLTIIIYGGDLILLLGTFFYFQICFIFGIILTSIIGAFQQDEIKINVFLRSLIGGLVGLAVACLIAMITRGGIESINDPINGILFMVMITGILSGVFGSPSNQI